MNARLLTPSQTSAYTGIPEATLADWRHRKVGPRYLMISGRRPRYDLNDVDSWIEERKVETAPMSEYRRMRGDTAEARGDCDPSRSNRNQRSLRR